MIGWHVPAALGALGLMALPIVIHLLRTHRARRIPFPTLRFIAPSRTSAVKFRPPSDLSLLLVRIAIIAAAALAMAQPVLVTDARVRVWNSRVARAVIVDASQAMQIPDNSGITPIALAQPLAATEAAGAMQSIQIETASLADGLTRGGVWLETAPPARREIVVLSTFRAGALTDAMLKQLPSSVGLRLMQVAHPIDARTTEGVRPLTPPGQPSAVQEVQLTGVTTSVTRKTVAGELRGARVVGLDPAMPAVQRLWRTLALAGTPAPSADRPIAFAFGDWPSRESVSPFDAETPQWMLQVLTRLRSDAGLHRAAASAPPSLLTASEPWVTVAVDRDGTPLARVARTGEELIMQVGAPIDSLFGAAAARAMLTADAGEGARPEQEVLRIAPATLEEWSRPAPPVDRQAWRFLDGSDARWLWAIALVLLAIEQWLRRSPMRHVAEVRDAA